MTPEEKRDRRKARQEVAGVFRKIVRRRTGLWMTPAQERAAVDIMVDRYYREQIRPAAERIEAEVLERVRKRIPEVA